MRPSWRHLMALALLVGAAAFVAGLPRPARAVAEPPGDEPPEQPRRLPQRIRDDPEHYARLKAEWHRFMKLPRDKRDRMRDFDEQLHEEDPTTQARLWAVLDRYATWLDHLDEKDRQEIESAGDHKLNVIKSLREREWIAHQPKGWRDRLDGAPPAERAALIESRRREERKRLAEWQKALRLQNDPIQRFAEPDLRPELQLYVEKSLLPTLNLDERRRLSAAQSDWPRYAALLKEFSERHPVRVPPSEKPGKRTIDDLPESLQRGLRLRGDRGGRGGRGMGGMGDPETRAVRMKQGLWPDFALAVVDLAKKRNVTLREPLGPCTPEEFVPPVQDFIKELRKDGEAAKRLDDAQGKWPDYPFAVMELAKEKKKRVPGTYLPGPPGFWERPKAGPRE
jgi:hypothetical protein